MPVTSGTLLLARDLATRFNLDQLEVLRSNLQQRLHQPVELWIEQPDRLALPEVLQSLIEGKVRRLTVLPLGLLPVSVRSAIGGTLTWAQRQWNDLEILPADPLTWIEIAGWLGALASDAKHASGHDPHDSGMLVVGRSSSSRMANAQLAMLAQLLREVSNAKTVGHAFLNETPPSLPEACRWLSLVGIKSLTILPWLLDDQSLGDMQLQVRHLAPDFSFPVQIVPIDLRHPTLMNLLVANHLAATPWTVRTSATNHENDAPDEDSISQEVEIALQALDARINAMLPSEYQGSYETVSPQSMGTAGLKYDDQGKVAWDQIWTSFCDLALAGGPPHRGTLLEAVTAEAANSDPDKYQAVTEEIRRGIQMVTGLVTVPSQAPGWVGVRCHSEEMAVWLMRAIIVENIMVRRERDVIYLPAGPHFSVSREIKNVITAVAKTVHYWTAHLKSRTT